MRFEQIVRVWLLRMRSLLRGRQVERELDDELSFHVEQRIEANIASGMTPEEARRAARLAMEGVEQQKEACRDHRRLRPIDELIRNVQYAWRMSRKDAGTTTLAILSLALAIGANTAIFSLVDSLLLRALPVKDPKSLVLVSQAARRNIVAWSPGIWQQIQQRPQLFDGTVAWSSAQFTLVTGDDRQPVDGLWASGSFFPTLGVPAIIGRTFTEADDPGDGTPSGPDGPVAMISYGFWQRRFAGATNAIGQTLSVDDVPFTIVGVTPPGFFGAEVGRTFDIALPLASDALLRGRQSSLTVRSGNPLTIMARLKPGHDVETAGAALRGVQPQIRAATLPERWPKRELDRYLTDPMALVPAATGNSILRLRYERPLLTIMVVVSLVLLIACANIANLLLARAAARRHEMGVRLALGASRARLLRQLLTESALLAATGAAFGLLIASWASRLLVRLISTEANPVFLYLSLDARILAFTIGVTVLTTMIFGVMPALRASGVQPMEAVKRDGRTTSAHGGWSPASRAARLGPAGSLVVAQVALSVLLLVAAGLFVRTFVALATRPLGFDRDRVLIVNIGASRATQDATQRLPLYERAVEAVRRLPGVDVAALSMLTPARNASVLSSQIRGISGRVPPVPEDERYAAANFIAPEWFNTLGTPLKAGRDFNDRDRKGTPLVAIVNEAFARKFFDGINPVGQTITLPTSNSPNDGQPIEIVGLSANAIYSSLRERVMPTLYLPFAQYAEEIRLLSAASLSVRSNGVAPATLTRSVAAAIEGVQPNMPLSFRPLTDQVSASLAQERVMAIVSGFFGSLALLLAGLGLYGVTWYAVTRRRAEIGIRIALGAEPRHVMRLVLARLGALVTIGAIAGAGASWWASRFIATLLYGLEPRDPFTLLGAIAILAAIAAVAGWLPARRAVHTDAARVLQDS